MNKIFKQQLLKIQALQIQASDLGFCMHVIVRGGIEIENKKRSHIDASLFRDSKQLYAVCEFENYGDNAGVNINYFIMLVTEYLKLEKEKQNGNTNSK